MTPEGARERVTDVRESMRRVMRALSTPRPDWGRATMEAADAHEALRALVRDLSREERKERRAAWAEGKTGGEAMTSILSALRRVLCLHDPSLLRTYAIGGRIHSVWYCRKCGRVWTRRERQRKK